MNINQHDAYFFVTWSDSQILNMLQKMHNNILVRYGLYWMLWTAVFLLLVGYFPPLRQVTATIVAASLSTLIGIGLWRSGKEQRGDLSCKANTIFLLKKQQLATCDLMASGDIQLDSISRNFITHIELTTDNTARGIARIEIRCSDGMLRGEACGIGTGRMTLHVKRHHYELGWTFASTELRKRYEPVFTDIFHLIERNPRLILV